MLESASFCFLFHIAWGAPNWLPIFLKSLNQLLKENRTTLFDDLLEQILMERFILGPFTLGRGKLNSHIDVSAYVDIMNGAFLINHRLLGKLFMKVYQSYLLFLSFVMSFLLLLLLFFLSFPFSLLMLELELELLNILTLRLVLSLYLFPFFFSSFPLDL